ncbi:MAG TPA: Uma2 family endonuclease [Anaerolineae bacterium]|nr:Uma2 family endonuclease [Anaerolineae bacterium]HIQ06436.1 Uma2 family endonuclease [Anaerolineae bacterium]
MVKTIERRSRDSRAWRIPVGGSPPLNVGDRLSRAEFERRYHAHPEIKKAELIEAVVYMSTPVRYLSHGRLHAYIVGWLTYYCAKTPGVDLSDNAMLRLDFENEPQPDALLRLPAALGGKSRIAEDGYLEGTPELIVQIAASSAAYDLHVKKRVYARNGVQEYLAIQTYEQRIDWFAFYEGVYQPLPPDDDGVLCSRVFPGLWLDPVAFWAGDLEKMLAVLEQGVRSPEHEAFVARLQK